MEEASEFGTTLLHETARRLTVYEDPGTGQLWVHIQGDNGEEDYSHCHVAVHLAQLLKRAAKRTTCGRRQRGYELPPPLAVSSTQPLCPGQHSRFDPYGCPWRIYHDYAAVIYCHNVVSVEDPWGGAIASICQRLYYSWQDAPPEGFCQAMAASQTRNKCTWYWMKTHKAKREGLLSHCTCCNPASVMSISWSNESTKELIEHCQQKLQAWIGLKFRMLPGDLLSTAKLPSV